MATLQVEVLPAITIHMLQQLTKTAVANYCSKARIKASIGATQATIIDRTVDVTRFGPTQETGP